MHWKLSKNLVIHGHVFVALWILLVSVKVGESFGNNANTPVNNGASDSIFIQATSTLTAPTVSYLSTNRPTNATSPRLSTQSHSPPVETLLHGRDISFAKNSKRTASLDHAKTSETYDSRATLSSTVVLGPVLMSSNTSTFNTINSMHPQRSSSSAVVKSSSNNNILQGPAKTFVAEIRITSLNFSSELDNKTSSLFRETAAVITKAVDFIMNSQSHYLGCQVVSLRDGSVIANIEIRMGPGSSSDPNIVLDRLKSAVESGRAGNLTVDSTYFVGWMKKDPPAREKLLSGQLAGIAVILFIFVVLLLVICLGKFADEPLFQESDIFSAELNVRNIETERHNEGNQNEEWKFDPLFAWSPQKTYDSKL